MIRATAVATLLTAGFSVAAVADEQGLNATPETAAFTTQLTAIANQQRMRNLLASQGHIVTSDLNRSDTGHWVGTTLKDGKPVRVALKMPPRQLAEPLTN